MLSLFSRALHSGLFSSVFEEFKHKRIHSLPLCMSLFFLTASCVLSLDHCSIQLGIFYFILPISNKTIENTVSQYSVKKSLDFLQWPLGLNVNIHGQCLTVRALLFITLRCCQMWGGDRMNTCLLKIGNGTQSFHMCTNRLKNKCE